MQLACVPLMPMGFVFVISHLPSIFPCVCQSRDPVCQSSMEFETMNRVKEGQLGERVGKKIQSDNCFSNSSHPTALLSASPSLRYLWTLILESFEDSVVQIRPWPLIHVSQASKPCCYCLYPYFQYPCASMSFKIITLVILRQDFKIQQ